MKRLLNIMFLSCFKATEMIEKGLHFKLSFKENIQLEVHKLMCDACTKYEKQSLRIEKGISEIEKTKAQLTDIVALKRIITSRIKGTYEN